MVLFSGYLIPPWKMRPWLKWLIWINPVQYCFEALMANEFYNLNIKCEPPYIVPLAPGASPQHQSCSIQGSRPGQTSVRGSDYIKTGFTYTRAHLWRNLGVVIAWFVLFVALTMLGMELQKPNKGGSSVTVFKRNEAPKGVENSGKHRNLPEDEETAEKDAANPLQEAEPTSSDENNVHGIAKNTSIFTWQNVNYTIPYKGGQRRLLQDVQGYVKPGRLTALMGASGAGSVFPGSSALVYVSVIFTFSKIGRLLFSTLSHNVSTSELSLEISSLMESALPNPFSID